ncbi:2-hydroxy-3-oxopropionate reductase [Arthrobacter horti]|uniref:2-hydroxy-3-oxopropionate reductase n=1 Tax=Arthrobacter horti TaxID=3068273 RepID=UPI00346094B1
MSADARPGLTDHLQHERPKGLPMTNVTVIGLGIMGLPMAKNLVNAGFNVTGFNRSQDKIDALVAAGGKGASSIAESVQDADVIITMVPDSPDVEGVVSGAEGVFANAKSGALWIDASSIRPDVAVRLSAAAREAGLRPLDGPVSGGEQGAIDGVLSIMVGGEAADFEAAQPVLNAVGKTIVHVGPSGSGQTVKAANQLIVAVNIQALAEAVVFLEAYGVDTDAALKVLGGGLAGSKVLDQKGQKMLDRNFDPGFRLALHNKDLGIVTSAAREAGVVVPLGSAVAQLVSSLVARGDGGLDHSGLFKLTTELAGKN